MIRGKSEIQQAEEVREREYQRALHANNLGELHSPPEDGQAAEILRILSTIDDLPIDPEEDPILGQLVSKLTSTANLSPEQVRSNEWVWEYLLVLYMAKHPPHTGVHGAWRGWSHADYTEALDPLSTSQRMKVEAFIQEGKLALTRSENAKVIEESTHTVHESVVHGDGNSKGGGILGKLKK